LNCDWKKTLLNISKLLISKYLVLHRSCQSFPSNFPPMTSLLFPPMTRKTLLLLVSIHCETNTMTTFLNNFSNNFGANSSLSRELSMAPHTTICLGCNKSFCRISLHWNQKPVCCSSHQQRSAAACHPVLSHGRHSHDFGSDGSSSETGSSGSESCPSPKNLEENGLLGDVIFSHRNDAAHGSSPSSSMVAKGMLHCETILADGSVANTQVSARIMKKWASRHQRTDPHFPPAEGDECKSMDEDWDDNNFSSLSTLQSEMFPNPGAGDDGDKPEEEEEEDEDMHSYTAAAGYQNKPLPDIASLSSGAPPGLGAVVHDPLEAALERLPSLLD
jgi:hypothetical protein